MLDDVRHNFDEALEWLSLSSRRRPRLQAHFGDNKRLCCNGCQSFGCSAKDWGYQLLMLVSEPD